MDKIKHKQDGADYAGRPISASTATGYGKTHAAELAAYLNRSMS